MMEQTGKLKATIMIMIVCAPPLLFLILTHKDDILTSWLNLASTAKLIYETAPFQAIFTYMLCYILITLLSLPLATLMSITGGFLFGPYLGTMLAVASATTGASLLFLILKKIGTHLPDTKNKSQLSQIINQLNQNSFYCLLSLRLMPSFPFFLVNLAAALLKIPLHIFFSASFLGMLPASFLYNSIGAAAMTLTKENLQTTMNPLYFALLFALAGTVLVYLLLTPHIRNRK